MHSETFEYRGFKITLRLFAKGEGRWTWAYRVGSGGYYAMFFNAYASQDDVWNEARHAAMDYVDSVSFRYW